MPSCSSSMLFTIVFTGICPVNSHLAGSLLLSSEDPPLLSVHLLPVPCCWVAENVYPSPLSSLLLSSGEHRVVFTGMPVLCCWAVKNQLSLSLLSPSRSLLLSSRKFYCSRPSSLLSSPTLLPLTLVWRVLCCWVAKISFLHLFMRHITYPPLCYLLMSSGECRHVRHPSLSSLPAFAPFILVRPVLCCWAVKNQLSLLLLSSSRSLLLSSGEYYCSRPSSPLSSPMLLPLRLVWRVLCCQAAKISFLHLFMQRITYPPLCYLLLSKHTEYNHVK
jgi:hypothetical protein